MNKFKKVITIATSFIFIITALLGKPPKITLIIVVDQLSYQTFNRLSPHFKYGFKNLLQNGACFTYAHHPHGNPVTATGHTTISTGAYAKDHGVVLNGWMDGDGRFVDFGDDDVATAAVFSKQGYYKYGLSAHHILVETLSDKLILQNNPQKQFSVYAFAHKPRAAIAMAGKLGKAIWFDSNARQYTSSKAYFNQLPKWLKQFNRDKKLDKLTKISWKLAYDKEAPAYQLPYINDYRFAATPDRLAAKTINLTRAMGPIETNNGEEQDFLYEETPWANDTLVDLCKKCIDTHKLQSPTQHLVLWVSISNYDMLGHTYGHHSMEATDLLYHLDQQLEALIRYAQQKAGKKQTLVVLTADHGCSPIPEILKAQGFYAARRINASMLKKEMNALIEEEFGVTKAVAALKNTQFFLNKKVMNKLASEARINIIKRLQTFLMHQPGIKKCWTKKELANTAFEPYNLEQYYKNQLHSQRSGDLIIMPYPYVYFSKYHKGTGHTCAYAYDTQVPLLLYQPGNIKKQIINQPVQITQLVPTLARIFDISCPSGAVGSALLSS